MILIIFRYERWASEFLCALRTTPPSPGHERVYYPGLHAAELRDIRKEEGIDYHPEVSSRWGVVRSEE